MLKCIELIEESGKLPRTEYWHVGMIFALLGQVKILEKIHTFDGVKTQLSHI